MRLTEEDAQHRSEAFIFEHIISPYLAEAKTALRLLPLAYSREDGNAQAVRVVLIRRWSQIERLLEAVVNQ